LDAFKELNKEYEPKEEPQRKPGEFHVVNNPLPILNIAPNGTWDKIGNERDLINKHLIDASELIRKFRKHFVSLKSFSSSLNTIKVIVWILIVSFPLTVIYPLHFLPVEIGKQPLLTFNIILIIKSAMTLKNILLFIFLFSVEGIFIYFLFFIRQIKTALSNLGNKHLEEYTNIYSYCEYYRE
jgi:hypothetical protein